MLRIALLFIPFYAARRSLRRFADGLRAVDFFKAAAVIFGVGLLSAAWAESPDIAGRVQFVVGEVSAADRAGAARALGKRDAIFEGDTVTTGPSASAQIMMIDGARIAVRPNSAFMVNEYRAPSADDIGASILTLLKGGFRTLSGLIGEESAQYRIDTPCCSIGLRGTDHAVFHIPEGEEDAYGGGEAGTYNRVYKGATFLESAGVTLDITPQTDAGFAARGQPPVFVPDIPETAEGAVVLAPSEDEDEESDESEAAENESKESESEDESESETETADADDSNSESDDAESESETETAETADADDSNSETETAETADADDSNSGSDDAVLAESPADESSNEIDDAVIVESPADESSSEIDDAVLAESPADESPSEIDNAGLAESPADESTSEIDNAGLVESPGELSSALETVEIAIESAVPPIADFQNPADIADALQRENTMPEPEPPSPVISLTSDLTMLQEGGQVILRISSDIAAPSGGLMVTINIGTAMAGEFGISGGVCSALECVVVIPAGMLAATLTITPISDTAMESAERWTATLVDGGLNYNIDNTMMDVGFDISDQPVIGIATADMAMVREGGEIRLTVSSDIAAPSGGLMVTINIGNAMAGEFGIAGGVCTALECVVTIPENSRTAELILTPISDSVIEDLENWMATLGDGGLNYNIDNTMMNVGFDIFDDPILLAVVDVVDGDILDDAPHVQGHDVVLAWGAVPGFDSASSYRVYRDGVRADGEFIDDRGTRSLTIDNGIGPLSFLLQECSPEDACRAAVENVPGASFGFVDFGLFDAESGRIIGLFDGGVSHTYEIRAVDENGVETLVVGPIALTAPAIVDNNLEDFVLPETNENIAEANAVLGAVNEYLPVSDAVMPSEFVIGNGGILASQTNMDVIRRLGIASDDRVFSYLEPDDDFLTFRAGTYEGTTPDLGNLLGLDDPPRVYVYRAGGFDSFRFFRDAGIDEFTFSYAIEAGAVTRLTDYNVEIGLSDFGERWEFGLADGSRVDLTHAETFFEVAGRAALFFSGDNNPIDGIASFGSNNERVFSRFSVEGGGDLLSGRFDIPAGGYYSPSMPQPDPAVGRILLAVADSTYSSSLQLDRFHQRSDARDFGRFRPQPFQIGSRLRDSNADAPHVQGHDVLLAWSAVRGFNDAADYRVYRDGVRANGQFTDDGGGSVDYRIAPLSFSRLLQQQCLPADACLAAVQNVPGASFSFVDVGLFDAESGGINRLFDGGVSHTYEIRTVDENGVETRVGDPITFTAPAVVDNNLEDFVLPAMDDEDIVADNAILGAVNEYLPVLDAVMPSDFIIGNGGILASQTDVDVISDDRVFSYSRFSENDFRAGTYEGTTPDLGYLLGSNDPPRVYVYRDGGSFHFRGAGINEFTFSYAIEAGDVTGLTDYDVLIRLPGERWEFGLADGSRVDLTHAETFFDVAGTADLGLSRDGTEIFDRGAPRGVPFDIDGIASFGSNNERVFSRFSVGGRLSGRFDIPATMPQPDPVDPILLAVVDGGEGGFFLEDAPHVQEHDVILGWRKAPGFDFASSYRVYRDGVRADGEFTDGSLTVNNGLGPLSASLDSCSERECFYDVSDVSDGSVNRVRCSSCFIAIANLPRTSFIFADFGLVDAESGRIISLFDGGVSHTYEIRVVDENGVETRVGDPIILTAPAVVDNNLEDFVLPEINANIAEENAILGAVNEYLPVLDAVMPSDFIIGNGGILASQTDVDVISDDRVFSYSDRIEDDFRASTYEGTTPDLGNLLGLDDPSRVYVYRAGGINDPFLTSCCPGIEEFTFSYAIEAGAVTRLTDYDVLIRPSGERWEFGLADGSRVDLTHAETFFDVAGTVDLNHASADSPGVVDIDGIASFGSNNERVFSRFSVGNEDSVISGRFDIPAGGNSE